MTHRLQLFIVFLAASLSPAASADPPRLGPPTHGVELPPQTFDVPVKAPNHTREPRGEWSLWGGVYLIQPVFNSNPAFLVNGGGGNFTRAVDFNRGLDAAPNVWLAYTSERGWGVRGRWFQYDHGNAITYGAVPGETITGMSPFPQARTPLNGVVNAFSNLAINVADIQATCTSDGPKWTHLAGIGVRYTHLNQEYQASVASLIARNDMTSTHNLNGAGPSFSLETRRRVGETGFAVYGQMHGAVVFGNAKENYTALANGVPFVFTHETTRILPVGELELGGEYARNIARARVFVQAGFVGQVYWSGGNASNLDAPTFTSAAHSNFGFIGLAIRAGVRY